VCSSFETAYRIEEFVMLIDARQLSPEAVLETDLCIVGSGPAAITMAQEFNNTPLRVLLLEAGGLEKVGGNARCWCIHTSKTKHSVRLLPLAEADFEERPSLPHSGWPITRDALGLYYVRAQMALGLAPLSYTIADWEEPWACELPIRSDRILTGLFQFGLGEAVRGAGVAELTRSKNITLCHHATALELLSNEQCSRVTAVRVASAPNREFLTKANQVVLAGGGFSAAELLLSSDRVQPAGLGNTHDVVGRYFMDHPLLLGGKFVPASRQLFSEMAFYDLHDVRGTSIMGHLTLSNEALRREKILNLNMMLYPRGENDRGHSILTRRQRQGFEAARRIRRRSHRSRPSVSDLVRAMRGADGVVKILVDKYRLKFGLLDAHLDRGGWSQRKDSARRFTHFEVLHLAEQAPHPDNRIVLTQERNALGQRKSHLEWQWHAEDVAATMRAQEVFAEELQKAGLGEFQIVRSNGAPVVIQTSTAHYMGATRMSDDPHAGVVDQNCRVHGIDNLFIASSSVFPTGGFANPTLTIVALSLRLADHLKKSSQPPLRTTAVPNSALDSRPIALSEDSNSSI
jgi:choline dehydrogenase-like flavoprotein